MSDTVETPNRQRRFWFIILGLVILAAAVAYGIYWLVYARYFESTDDAYVSGNVVTITSKENATVLALHADNTQTVKQGQLLIPPSPPSISKPPRPIWRGWCAMSGRNFPSPIPARPS
jgi:membrane fusion protein, multidrug efflux system